MRRDDVVHHSDGYREGHPAINIKLYSLWEANYRMIV